MEPTEKEPRRRWPALPASLFLALKYLRPKRTFVSIVTVLSVLGVLLGVAVLIVVLSVMSGFDDLWREKILAFNAHITVSSPVALEADADFLETIESTPGVAGAAPFVQGLVFLQKDGQVVSPFLRGIEPAREARISQIPGHMTQGVFDPGPDGILLGNDLARRLGARVGDTVLAFSPQSFAAADELRLPEEVRVAGIFEMGMYDVDMGYALCSLPLARDLFGLRSGVHGVQVMTHDPFRAGATASALRARLGWDLDIRTWAELNRQLFDALRVEKNMMFFLLIFITIVAAFGITNTLITVTVQKTREIGLLKAVGFSSGCVMRIFFWQGWVAGFLGTALGIGAGLLTLKYRNHLMFFLSRRLGLDLLPKELYQLSEIPSRTSAADVLLVAGAVLAICTLAGLIPAWRAARLDPARAIRYE